MLTSLEADGRDQLSLAPTSTHPQPNLRVSRRERPGSDVPRFRPPLLTTLRRSLGSEVPLELSDRRHGHISHAILNFT